jgi:hypothetical protein
VQQVHVVPFWTRGAYFRRFLPQGSNVEQIEDPAPRGMDIMNGVETAWAGSAT